MVDKNNLKERLNKAAGNIISMVEFQMKDVMRKPRRKEHAGRLADLAAALHSAAETLACVEQLEAAERFYNGFKIPPGKVEVVDNGNDQKN